MPNTKIESWEFRNHARNNCYKYGSLYIYSNEFTGLDNHNFPNYRQKDGVGAVEKFLTLVQSLGKVAAGNDATQKLAKPIPGVEWSGDSLGLSLSVSGTMYFLDYSDYKTCKSRIRSELVAQGWQQNVTGSKIANISMVTYQPKKSASDALYNDDPIDAAGMAMMVSAMQTATLKTEKLAARLSADKAAYAEAQARLDTRTALASKSSPKLSKLGSFGADLGAGIDAFGANTNSGLLAKWYTAGHPLELRIENKTVAKSINGVMTDLKLTEKAYVVDSKSGGVVYPTEMEVSLSITNLYGALLTASSKAK